MAGNKRIGEIFEVEEYSDTHYSVIHNEELKLHNIRKDDCELITDPVKIPFSFELWDKDRTQKVWTRDGREVKQLTLFDALDYAFAGVIDGELEAFTKEGYAIIGGKDIFNNRLFYGRCRLTPPVNIS